MALYLGLLIFSFIITSIAIVPFIDLLYRSHFTYSTPSPHITKIRTPVGGGVLIITLTTFLYIVLFPLVSRLGVYINASFPILEELNIVFFTFISFALLGLYEDIAKTFHRPFSPWAKHATQLILSLIVTLLIFRNLDIHIVNTSIFPVFNLGIWYIPLSVFVIYLFARGLDITDGLDGLASGVLVISLLAIWAISVSHLDTPLSIFIALWVGSLIPFLYFNVYPARIWLGNSGSMSFGATLAVIGLLLGKPLALFVIGGIFVAGALSNLLQTFWKKFFHRRLFPVTPPHYWLISIGWSEPKVVQRMWLVGLVLAVTGLLLASY